MGNSSQDLPIIVYFALDQTGKICNFGVKCLLANDPQCRQNEPRRHQLRCYVTIGAAMLIEMRQLRCILFLGALSLCLPATATAQGGTGTKPDDQEIVHGLSLKDFALVGPHFADSDITSREADNIAAALKDVLDLDVQDRWIITDPKARAQRHPTNRERRDMLGEFRVTQVAVLPGNVHLYVMRNAPYNPDADGVNGRLLIVETSPGAASLLGESSGWGVATRPRPGQAYPTLVFISHLSAMASGMEVLDFDHGKYVKR
jgi:hypothetical protein